MVSIPQGPALPWAAADASKGGLVNNQQTATECTQSDLHAVAIDQLGLSHGDRIEVLWAVEPDPPAEPYQRWWGASITGVDANQDVSSTTGPCYQLRYDRAPDDGFDDEEVVTVQLLAEHSLFDCDRDDVMCWRREGDSYEPPDESEGADDGDDMSEEGLAEGDDEGGTVSLQQLASCITDADVAASEATLLDRLADNPAGQIQAAASFRDFMEDFKAFIAAKVSSQSGAESGVTTYTITRSDMEEFKAIMQTKKAQHK